MTLALPILRPAPSAGASPPGAPPAAPRPRPAQVSAPPRRMIDSFGRTIRDLRLSITDRCNFRCVYCMEPDVRFMDPAHLLSVEEMARLVRVCAGLGVEKVRLTGGEPTVHPDLTRIIREVARAAGPAADVAMTTNGSIMDDASLADWRDAGLRRITVSIDTLDPASFAAITRARATPQRVIEGLHAAARAGFDPIKANAVVVRGFNEDQVPALARLARDLDLDMRFIEFMPLDSAHAWDPSRLVPASEIVDRVGAVYPLRPADRDDPASTALVYRFADGAPGRIGVIAPVTRSFCGACSRLRITADGKVRPCLFSVQEWDIRPLLRNGADDEALARFLADATWTKQAGHGIATPGFVQPDRPMSAIGG